MKIMFSAWLLCFCAMATAQDNDPFDKTRRIKPATEAPANQASSCISAQSITAQDIAFQRLKIIGLLQYKEHNQVLLSDENQRVFTAERGQLVGQEGVKVSRIDKREIQFVSRRPDCSDGELISMKF